MTLEEIRDIRQSVCGKLMDALNASDAEKQAAAVLSAPVIQAVAMLILAEQVAKLNDMIEDLLVNDDNEKYSLRVTNSDVM